MLLCSLLTDGTNWQVSKKETDTSLRGHEIGIVKFSGSGIKRRNSVRRDFSRVLEVNPMTFEKVWEFSISGSRKITASRSREAYP